MTVENLPSELLPYILLQMGDPLYVARLARVSKKMNANLSHADKKGHMSHYWYELYQRDFLKKNKFDKDTDYRELYKKVSQERTRDNKALSTKQKKLFSWIRSGDLDSIKDQKWLPETDFGGAFDAEGNNAISLACLYKRKAILKYFYEEIKNSVSSNLVFGRQRRMKLLFWAAACNIESEINFYFSLDPKIIDQSFTLFDRTATLDEAMQSEVLGSVFNAVIGRVSEQKQALTSLTPLCVAAQNGNLEAMKILIKVRADVNHPADRGNTPLYIAVQNENLEAIQLLITADADVNQPCRDRVTSLSCAASRGNVKTMQVLLEAGANVDQSDNNNGIPLYYAVRAGHLGAVQALLNAGAKTNQTCGPLAIETVLYRASIVGNLEVVQALLKAGAEVNQRCYSGTALHAAARYGHYEIVQVLLEAGAKTDLSGFHGDATPLSMAVAKDHFAIYELLKMWEMKVQLNEKSLLEKVITIIETPIQWYTIADQLHNIADSFKSLFFSKPSKLEATIISDLKKMSKSEDGVNKELLIKILQQNRSNIPASKYEFIFKYLLEDKISVVTQKLDDEVLCNMERGYCI